MITYSNKWQDLRKLAFLNLEGLGKRNDALLIIYYPYIGYMDWYKTLNMIKNVKFRTRFIASNSIVLLLMVIIAFFVYHKVNLLITTSRWVTHTYVAINYGTKLTEALLNMETGERGFVITGKEEFLEPYHLGKKQFAETIEIARKHVSDNVFQLARLDTINLEAEHWRKEEAEVIIQKKNAHQDKEVNDLIASEKGKKQMDKLRNLIDDFMESETLLLTVRNNEAEQAAYLVIYITLIGTAVAIIFSFFVILVTSRSIMTVVKRVVNSSAIVNHTAEEFAEAHLNLNQRTEEQAASLEQTSSSMAQLTATVQQTAENVKRAAQLTDNARAQALNGGSAVEAVVKAMTAINHSSSKVADVLCIIDEITFHTNLLALNAAVEAARAGDQGRGFAVVATEIRHLAQRSTVAAKEIRLLIKDSTDKITEGTQLANHSGNTLTEIITVVKKVNDIMSDIAAASTEQATGIEQISKAVLQLDSITQHNASLVEEAMAASESLKAQAEHLKADIAFFSTTQETRQVQPVIQEFVKPEKPASEEPSKTVVPKNVEEWQDF